MNKKWHISALSLLILVPNFLQAYSMSVAVIDSKKGDHPPVLIFGDAHKSNVQSKEHFDMIQAAISQWRDHQNRIYISLEDRPWEHIDGYTDSTLNDLVVFAREHNKQYGSIVFGSADSRSKSLLWARFFFSEFYYPTFTANLSPSERFEQTVSWLEGIYGTSPHIYEIIDGLNKHRLELIEAQELYTIDLGDYLTIITDGISKITKLFKGVEQKEFLDVCEEWFLKDKQNELFAQQYPLFKAVTNAVADAGFILDFYKNKDKADFMLFYVGHAHACSLVRFFQKLDQSSVVCRIGPDYVPRDVLHCLPKSVVFDALKYIPLENKLNVTNTFFDFLLFIMVLVLGSYFTSRKKVPKKYAIQ